MRAFLQLTENFLLIATRLVERARSLQKRWRAQLESVKRADSAPEAQAPSSASASASGSGDRPEESSAAAADETLRQEQGTAYVVQLDLETYLKNSDEIVEHLKETGAECMRAQQQAQASLTASTSSADDKPSHATKSKRGSPNKGRKSSKHAAVATVVTSAEALYSISAATFDSPDSARPPPPLAGAAAAASDAPPTSSPVTGDAQAADTPTQAPPVPTDASSPQSPAEAAASVRKLSHRLLPNFTLNHVVLVEKCA